MNDDENRKRVHQDDFEPAFSSKRAALGTSTGTTTPSMYSLEPDTFLFKLLCPQSVTGFIIGRKGAIINQLNHSTGAKIRLSQNHEFYPGTTDRILLINGSKDCIANALSELVSRIVDPPEKKASTDMYGNPTAPVNRGGSQGIYQIRILIPRIASAAIIGRKGAVIQRMGEVSNCKFQLGDENDPYNTRERILVISSTSVANVVTGTQTLMAELLADTRIRNYPNNSTSYASGGNSNSNHSGSNGQQVSHMMSTHPPGGGSGYRNHANYASMSPLNGPPPLLPVSPYSNQPVAYGMQSMQPNQYMVTSGFAAPPVYPPMTQMTPMNMAPPMQPMLQQTQMFSMVPQQEAYSMPQGNIVPNGFAPNPMMNGYPNTMQASYDPNFQSQQAHMVQYSMPNNHHMVPPNMMYGGGQMNMNMKK